MKKLELILQDELFEKTRRLAAVRHCSFEQLIEDLLQHLSDPNPEPEPVLGMFSDEPDLLDGIVECTMKNREEHPLRYPRE